MLVHVWNQYYLNVEIMDQLEFFVVSSKVQLQGVIAFQSNTCGRFQPALILLVEVVEVTIIQVSIS